MTHHFTIDLGELARNGVRMMEKTGGDPKHIALNLGDLCDYHGVSLSDALRLDYERGSWFSLVGAGFCQHYITLDALGVFMVWLEGGQA